MRDTVPPLAANGATPPLSVVMPVHNALPYLDQAIESILGQTFADFEFVILDDSSSDGSRERLRSWAARDSRIVFIEADERLGPVRSSNAVAGFASGSIVARMDADDTSSKERLSEQLTLLRKRDDAGLVASLCDLIDEKGRPIRGPESWRLLRKSPMVPFAHGTIMYRKAVFDAVGGYREGCEYWEDQDLITRIATTASILVIPRVLYSVRQTSNSTRATSKLDKLELALNTMFALQSAPERMESPAEILGLPKAGYIDPRVFISVGSPILWSGQRPRLFLRLLRRGSLRCDGKSIEAVVWTAWASASPTTLRLILRGLLKIRNLRAGRVSKGRPIGWHPSEPTAPSAFVKKQRA